MDGELAIAQSLKYAEELRQLYDDERAQRNATQAALDRLESSYRTTVRALAAALELRDDQTGDHAQRVTRLALRLAAKVAPDLLREPQLEYGFLLHDLGKIGIRDAVLLKPGRLTPAETKEMRFHPVLGERIVAGIPYLAGVARQVVAAHHERWDGTGYPRRLPGDDIPLPARIFAVVDAFDAITNDRPYRSALPLDAAMAEIEFGAGTQFDPAVVEAFLLLADERRVAA